MDHEESSLSQQQSQKQEKIGTNSLPFPQQQRQQQEEEDDAGLGADFLPDNDKTGSASGSSSLAQAQVLPPPSSPQYSVPNRPTLTTTATTTTISTVTTTTTATRTTTGGIEELAIAAPVTSNADIEARVRQRIQDTAVRANEVEIIPDDNKNNNNARPDRRRIILIAGVLVLLIGIIIGVVVATTAANPATPSPQPSISPFLVPAPGTQQPTASIMPSRPPSAAPVVPLTVAVTVVIQLDEYPTETGWSLVCNGVEYADFERGTYFMQHQVISEVRMVENGAACQFRVSDNGFVTRGICCDRGAGFYQVYLGNDTSIQSNLVGQGGDGKDFVPVEGRFEDFRSTVIFVATLPPPTMSPAPSDSSSPTMLPTTSTAPTRFLWMQLGPDIDVGENTTPEARSLGSSVSLSDNGMIAAVGAPGGQNGSAVVLQYSPDSMVWELLGQALHGVGPSDGFGVSVALSGNGTILAVGAPNAPQNEITPGYAKVYRYEGQWIQMGQTIHGEAMFSCCTGDNLGGSVSLSRDGNILALSARGPNSQQPAGYVRVFEYDALTENWIQMGPDLAGVDPAESPLAIAMSNDGTVVAIGIQARTAVTVEGRVRVMQYNKDKDEWFQIGQTIAGGASQKISISGDGSLLALGIPSSRRPFPTGSARVYEYDPAASNWTQIGETLIGEFDLDDFGSSVSLSREGNVLAVGAIRNFANGNSAGHVRMFEIDRAAAANRGEFKRIGEDIDGEAAEDRFGTAVSVSANGSVVAVGAPRNRSFLGHVRIFGM